jgi:hypothetical protein
MKKISMRAGLLTALGLGSVLACGPVTDVQNEVCCTEFKVGASISADVGGSVQSQVAAQAVADVAGIASAAVDDLTTACRSIAQDLDVPKDKLDAAEKEPDRRKKLRAWCTLAIDAIGAVKIVAGTSLKIAFEPPKCEASINAKANCQAKCSASGECNLKAHPPSCTGGSLQIACKGSCSAKAGAKLTCEGKCTGSCKGSCTASGGVAVQCSGQCEGTCSADAQGNGNGLNAQGECAGFCKGTCTAKAEAPAVACEGSCKGECDAKCEGTAEVAVKCDGDCDVDYEPISCEGGKLEGGCEVEAKCDSSCDASVKAKAQCTPPSVAVVLEGAANVQAAGKLKATLEANLPLVFAFHARLDGMAEVADTMKGNIEAFTDVKPSCLVSMGVAAGNALEDVKASFEVTGQLSSAVGVTP